MKNKTIKTTAIIAITLGMLASSPVHAVNASAECDKIAGSAVGNFHGKQNGMSKEQARNLREIFVSKLTDPSAKKLFRSMVDIGYSASSASDAYNTAHGRCMAWAKSKGF